MPTWSSVYGDTTQNRQKDAEIAQYGGVKGSAAWARAKGVEASEKEARQQRAYSDPKHRLYRGQPKGTFDSQYKPFMEAMQATQAGAAADRTSALAEIRAGKEASLGALDPFKQQIEGLAASPQAIGEQETSQMYEAGRTGIEAGAQAQMRELSESGGPGGFRQAQTRGVMAGTTGQLADLRRKIELEKIGGKEKRKAQVADLWSKYGQQVGDVQQRGSEALKNIYSQTIASVPQLKYSG